MSWASESGHWYDGEGNPRYTIVGKNGKERPTTLRDAKILNLVPSVTTITKCAAAPGLENWKIQQMKLAALTLPRLEGESEKDWLDRVDNDSREASRKAADRGSEVHGWLEQWFRDRVSYGLAGAYGDRLDWVYAADAKISEATSMPPDNWSAEKSFFHPLGFGGKCDLHGPNWVIDFKTKAVIDDGKQLAYDEHIMQLAAYREGFNMPGARCANLFITTSRPVKVVWVEHGQEELTRGWEMFKSLLNYWKVKSRVHN